MQQFYIKKTGQTITISDHSFASGGEGELFEVLGPSHFNNLVAKIIYPKKRDEQREVKLQYLIDNPPVFDENVEEEPIVWVKYLLHNAEGEFVGFLMPRATGEKLEILTSPKLPKHLGKEWGRFRLGDDEALRLRLKVCYNLAAALRRIHATGKYVLVDLKPDNVLIKSNGVVSIVDTDSIEVIDGDKTLFPATVATPDYTPAEYYTGKKPGLATIDSSWDCFSLAVIYYRLLFGVHPFAATAKEPYDNINSLGDKIEMGLFIHNPKWAQQFLAVPPPHRQFGKLDGHLRKLFLKAFVDGHDNPYARPSAEEWGQGLMNHPLLVINRPLPSKILNLDAISEKNWYQLALEKVMQEQNLVLSPKEKKAVVNANYSNEDLLQEALGYYKKGAVLLGNLNVLVFGGAGLMAMIILGIISFLGGAAVSDIIWGIISFIPYLIMELGLGFFFLLLISPFLLASFRQFKGIASDKTQNVRRNLIGKMSFTPGQKKKSLEELQYTLFSQRTKLKQRLRDIQNELVVWAQIKNTKEKEFLQKNNNLIVESNRDIDYKLKGEKSDILTQDEKAKKLMEEEAYALKKIRLDLQKMLQNHAIYSQIQGKNIPQKISFLEQEKAKGETTFLTPKISSIIAELQVLEQELKDSLEAVKQDFDAKHQAVQESTNGYKIKIDDLMKTSIDSMRQRTKIDENLMDDSFKKMLKNMHRLQEELNEKEMELEELNGDIKVVKEELRELKIDN